MITKQKPTLKFFHGIIILIVIVILTSCSSEKNHWEETKSENSISAYEKFLEQYPQGEFADQARLQIESIFFEQAKASDTIDAYKDFLNRYPEGKLVEQAHLGIMGIHFEQAKAAGSISAYDEFIERYAQGDYIEQAREMIEKIYPVFSKEKVVEIESILSYVRKGKLVFKRGEKPNTMEVELPEDIPVVNGKWCMGCAEIIKIEPNLRVSLEPYFYDVIKPKGLEKPQNLPSFAEYSVKLVTPIPDDTTECIISGPKGATLKKEAKGFRLVEGEARLFRKKMDRSN